MRTSIGLEPTTPSPQGPIRSDPGARIDGVEAATSTRSHPPVSDLRAGQRFEGRYACLAQGPAHLAQRLLVPLPEPARPHRDDARRGSSATRTGSACASSAGDAIAVRGKVERFRGELVAELDDARRLERRRASTRPTSCPPPTARPRSSRGSSSTWSREVARPGAARGGRAGRDLEPGRGGLPARARDPGRAPRLPRRPARAHGRRRDPGRRGLPAPPAARLRPADGGGARPRRRAGAGVHLRRRLRGQRRGADARPPRDRRRDRRLGRRLAGARAPAGAASLPALAPRPRRRPRPRRSGRRVRLAPRRLPSTG